MRTYIETVLGPDETVEYQARLSLWTYAYSFAAGAIFFCCIPFALYYGNTWPAKLWLTFILLLCIGVSILAVAIPYYCTELAITNKRIIAKFGFIARNTIETNLEKVESVGVAQGIIARIFNYGSIVIVGSGSSHAPIPGISDPIAFRKKYDEVAHAQKQN